MTRLWGTDSRGKVKVLVELNKTGDSPKLQAEAREALKSLDEAKSLVNKLEYGDTRGLDAWIGKGNQLASELGLKTKLSRALMASEVVSGGPGRTRKLADATSASLGGNPSSGIDEKTWVATYLGVMVEKRGPVPQAFIERRVKEFKALVDKGDWELSTYQPAPPNPSFEPTDAGKPASAAQLKR